MKSAEQTIQELWDNQKQSNIHIMEIPEVEEKEKGQKKYLNQ